MPLGQAQMEKEVAIIRAWRSSYSHEYLERCRAIKVCGERRQPVEWDPTSSFVWCITREQARRIQETERAAEAAIARERMDEDMDAERASQARRLFVLDPDMASLLANAHEDDNLEVPFELAPDQQDFVKSSGSKMAIGRSGTGKTTAIFKIV